jgi:thioredoxin 2
MRDRILVVCPECNAGNRLPSERLAENPSCGRCHKSIFTGHPVSLDEIRFNRLMQHPDLPLLIDCWAPWCGPCQMMAPHFETACADLEPQVRLAKINTEEQPGLGARLSIRSIPTLILFAEGKEVARQSGAMGAADIVRWTRAQLNQQR